MASEIATGSPPSDYAIYALVQGEPGAAWRVAKLTLVRSLLIAPGLFFAGLRGKQLAVASLAASTSVTAALTGWYAACPRSPTPASPSTS